MRTQTEQMVRKGDGEALKCPLSFWYSLYSLLWPSYEEELESQESGDERE